MRFKRNILDLSYKSEVNSAGIDSNPTNKVLEQMQVDKLDAFFDSLNQLSHEIEELVSSLS